MSAVIINFAERREQSSSRITGRDLVGPAVMFAGSLVYMVIAVYVGCLS